MKNKGIRKEEMASEFPDEVLEHVLVFLTSNKDRNAVSLVCQAWCRAEAESRHHVFIGNCYSVSPDVVIRRFPKLKSLTLKGKPRFADFSLFPQNWGAYLYPWISAFSEQGISLEELRLKRMNVSDRCLDLLARSFPNFRILVLTNCEGFTTDGLSSIASQCRNIQELQLQESLVDDRGGNWLRSFPETCRSLVALNFSCLDCDVDFDALESLVARCASLRSLGLNKKVSLRQLQKLLLRASQLTDLGTGSFSEEMQVEQIEDLIGTFGNCRGLTSLSGFWEADTSCLTCLYPVCSNLTSLNLSYVTLRNADLVNLLGLCHNLQRLWLQDNVEDSGLQAVASTCRDLRELRVFPSDPDGPGMVTEQGLLSIAEGCANLSSLLYFCRQMTNSAMLSMSRCWSKMRRFRLCIVTPMQPDHVTREPLDEGFGSIVRNCKDLKRLAVSGLLTDTAFRHIGEFGKKLETLSVAFAAESDAAMEYVVRGCRNLRKLEIRDCPFGDSALLSGLEQYESMRFLYLSSCRVTIMGCDELSKSMVRLNVEVVKQVNEDDYTVDNVYVYRTVLPSARSDRPSSVISLRGGDYFFNEDQLQVHPLPVTPAASLGIEI